MSNTSEFRYLNPSLRVTTRSDPARGGKRVETRGFTRSTTVLHARGIRHEVTSEYWKDIGTVMDPPTNIPARRESW